MRGRVIRNQQGKAETKEIESVFHNTSTSRRSSRTADGLCEERGRVKPLCHSLSMGRAQYALRPEALLRQRAESETEHQPEDHMHAERGRAEAP